MVNCASIAEVTPIVLADATRASLMNSPAPAVLADLASAASVAAPCSLSTCIYPRSTVDTHTMHLITTLRPSCVIVDWHFAAPVLAEARLPGFWRVRIFLGARTCARPALAPAPALAPLVSGRSADRRGPKTHPSFEFPPLSPTHLSSQNDRPRRVQDDPRPEKGDDVDHSRTSPNATGLHHFQVCFLVGASGGGRGGARGLGGKSDDVGVGGLG